MAALGFCFCFHFTWGRCFGFFSPNDRSLNAQNSFYRLVVKSLWDKRDKDLYWGFAA